MTANIKRPSINGNALKMIAIVTMLIDHLTYVIVEGYMLPKAARSFIGGADLQYTAKDYKLWATLDSVGRGIGRLAFPIFLFLMLEGFLHTRNVWKYALRLAIFALISEIPFNMAFTGNIFDLSYQNVFFTLLIGLLMMIGFEAVSDRVPESFPAGVLQTLVFVAALAAAGFLKCDYTYMGVAMTAAVYITRNHRNIMWLAVMVAMILTLIPSNSSIFELIGCFSFLFIACYNGERGSFNMKYFFYLFYPVHILILGLLNLFVLK